MTTNEITTNEIPPVTLNDCERFDLRAPTSSLVLPWQASLIGKVRDDEANAVEWGGFD